MNITEIIVNDKLRTECRGSILEYKGIRIETNIRQSEIYQLNYT